MGQRTSISQLMGVVALVATAAGCAGRMPSQAGAPAPMALDLRGAGASLTRKLASLEFQAPALLVAPAATLPVSSIPGALTPIAGAASVDLAKPLVTLAAADAPKAPVGEAAAPATAPAPATLPAPLDVAAPAPTTASVAAPLPAAPLPAAPPLAGAPSAGVIAPVATATGVVVPPASEPAPAAKAGQPTVAEPAPAIAFMIPMPGAALGALADAVPAAVFQDGFDKGLSAWMTRGLGTSLAAADSADAVVMATTRARRSTWIKTRDAIDLGASAEPRLKLAFKGHAAPLRAVWETEAGEFPEEIMLTPRTDMEYDLSALKARPGRLVLVARASLDADSAPVLDGVTIYDASRAQPSQN